MKGQIDPLAGGGCALGKSRVPKEFGESRSKEAVIFPRLTSESEESEEDECTKNNNPPIELQRINQGRAHCDPGELEDAGISPVSVVPGDPRADNTVLGVQDNTMKGQRDGEEEIYGG